MVIKIGEHFGLLLMRNGERSVVFYWKSIVAAAAAAVAGADGAAAAGAASPADDTWLQLILLPLLMPVASQDITQVSLQPQVRPQLLAGSPDHHQ